LLVHRCMVDTFQLERKELSTMQMTVKGDWTYTF
jgi:hypothetical protein